MKQVLTLATISILIFTCLSSCKDEYGFSNLDLKKEEKGLLIELVTQLKSDPQITKTKLELILSAKPSFEEIDTVKAKALFKEYDIERRPTTQATMRVRYGDASFKDTRSVVFPAKPLFDYLISAFNTGKTTGIRFVFGGYERDEKKYNSVKDSGDVTFSGRTCLFMLTSIYDSTGVGAAKQYFWRDSVRKSGSKVIAEGFGIYNHGSLCPNDCTGTSY